MDVLGPHDTPDNELQGSSDVLFKKFSDVSPEDLKGRISEELNVQYLSPMECVPSPVAGIVSITRANKLRVLVTLPVSARDRSVATHFILATGVPRSYIAQAVIDALGVPEAALAGEVIKINGVKANVCLSDSSTAAFAEGDDPWPQHFGYGLSRPCENRVDDRHDCELGVPDFRPLPCRGSLTSTAVNEHCHRGGGHYGDAAPITGYAPSPM